MSWTDTYTSARWIHQQQQCSCCHNVILKGAPGGKSGTRGTRAFYSPRDRAWLCLGCHGWLFA